MGFGHCPSFGEGPGGKLPARLSDWQILVLSRKKGMPFWRQNKNKQTKKKRALNSREALEDDRT